MLYFYVFFVCHCSILYLGVLTDDYGLSKSSKKYITNPTKKIPTTHFSYFERWKYVLTTYDLRLILYITYAMTSILLWVWLLLAFNDVV